MNPVIATILTTALLVSPTLSYASDGLDLDENISPIKTSTASYEQLNNTAQSISMADPYKAPAKTSTPIGGNVEKPNFTSPTSPSQSRGDITENVGEDGHQFDSDIPPKRQFLTFQTDSGKEFHLIIDYSKNDQQVRMLTEVSESDLLNLINKSRKNSGELNDSEETREDMEIRLKAEIKEQIEKEEAEMILAEQESNMDKKPNSTLFIIALVALFVGGFGYYKKIYLKNKNTASIDDEYEDSDEDNEYLDEYEDDYIANEYDEHLNADISQSSDALNKSESSNTNDDLSFEEGFEEDYDDEFNKKE